MVNITPQDIIDTLRGTEIILSRKNEEYAEFVQKKASSEKAYNMAVAEKTIRFKMDGIAITLIDKLVKGDKNVAQLKLDLDIADGVLKACNNSIRIALAQIDTYRSLLAWLKAEMHSR